MFWPLFDGFESNGKMKLAEANLFLKPIVMSKKIQRIKDIPDNCEFKLSDRSEVSYRLDRKAKGKAIITSLSSNRTYRVSLNKPAYNI